MAQGNGWPIWYELITPDPAKVREFYAAMLGWKIPDQSFPSAGEGNYFMIERAHGGHAGGMLELTPAMAEHGTKPMWVPYFNVSDVDAATAKAKELGAEVFLPPVSMGGAGRMAMLGDPTGGCFYLMTPTPPPDQPDAQSDVFSVTDAGHCRWNELMTTSEPDARAFYTALFDWSAENTMETLGDGVYRMVEMAGTTIGAISSMMPPGWPSAWLPYFGVADIDAAKAAMEANGGNVFHGPQEVPGGEAILLGTDPSGAHVGFVGPRGS